MMIKTKEDAAKEFAAELMPHTYLEIDEGWLPMFCSAARLVRYYNSKLKLTGDSCIKINTVKEKFGHLRIYLSYGAADATTVEHLGNAVDGICSVSGYTCEACGKLGKLGNTGKNGTGWLKTYCEEHAAASRS